MTTNDTLLARSGTNRADAEALWRRMSRRDNLRELIAPRPRHRAAVIDTVAMLLLCLWGASFAYFGNWLDSLPLSSHVDGILATLVLAVVVLAVALRRTQRKLEAAIALLLQDDDGAGRC